MTESPTNRRTELASVAPRAKRVVIAWLCTSLEVLGIWYIVEWLHTSAAGEQGIITGARIPIAAVIAVGYVAFTQWLARARLRPTV